jgi:hypothetical protein
MSPSTDIWGNLCAEFEGEQLQAGQLVEGTPIPLSVTVHNVLQVGNVLCPPPCYVLRRAAWPIYDDQGNFEAADYYCDGRFRRKLHKRKEAKWVSLHRAWLPGPLVPPPSTFQAAPFSISVPDEVEASEESEEVGAREESEEESVDISSDDGDGDEIGVDDASLAYARGK